MLLPVREDLENPISLGFTSCSKQSTFENRAESAESRALERSELFGEEWRALPIGRPDLRSEIATNAGLNCEYPGAENRRLRRSWRRERNWDPTFSTYFRAVSATRHLPAALSSICAGNLRAAQNFVLFPCIPFASLSPAGHCGRHRFGHRLPSLHTLFAPVVSPSCGGGCFAQTRPTEHNDHSIALAR
jgi:hypothetical protein